MMKRTIACFFAFAAAGAACADGVGLDADFDNGIPEGFTLLCNDNMAVAVSDYNHMAPSQEWFTAEVYGTRGKAAVSVSRRQYADVPTDNWLITPRLRVASDKVWLRWDARSVHHDLRDGYSVMVSTGDFTAFEPLLTVGEEAYTWTSHAVSLAAFAGKDVYIAIRHNSTHRFMLAVDNMFVGEPDMVSLSGRNTSRHFVGDEGTVTVTGSVCNTGRALDLKEFILVTGQGQIYTMPCATVLGTGARADYAIELPVEVGCRYGYTVKAVETDGTGHPVVSDVVVCSYFPRTLLVEKFTGLWCVSCPSAVPFVHALEDRFGSEAAVVEVHGYTEANDPMTNGAYIKSLGINNYPTVMYNRRETQTGMWGNEGWLEAAMTAPTDAGVATSARWTDDGRVEVATSVRFAVQVDNTGGDYRVGYIMKERRVDGGAYPGRAQKNGCAQAENEEYRYLPTSIGSGMTVFANVARGGEDKAMFDSFGTYSGIKGNMPAGVLEPQREYKVCDVLDVPETVVDRDGLEIVAVLFKSANVVNAALAGGVAVPGGIAGVPASAACGIGVRPVAGGCRVTLPSADAYTVVVCSVDGRIVRTVRGSGTECAVDGLGTGCYVVRAVQDTAASAVRICVSR